MEILSVIGVFMFLALVLGFLEEVYEKPSRKHYSEDSAVKEDE